MKIFPFLLMAVFIISCGTSRPNSGVLDGSSGAEYTEPEIITQSLFNDKESNLSEADIQRLLNGKIVLPDTLRIALLNYSHNRNNRYYTYYWSNEEYLQLKQRSIDTLRSQISALANVQKVTPMPAILANTNSKLVQMREAAVRLQSDLLLIYHLRSDIYYQYKFFQKDIAKAYATCELVLMDVRTGMIPFSTIRTTEYTTRKQEQDINIDELRKRAEERAILQTLGKVGAEVAVFLR